MIDFSTLKSLTIPEGKVIQITDINGNILWAFNNVASDVVSLQVEKITSNTYANNKTYSNEEFIVLDVVIEAHGTVNVIYGNMTKTIENTTNSESTSKVFFGTFEGVSDEITTPASGELRIEGDCVSFGVGTYRSSKALTGYCSCITAVNNMECITYIKPNAFYRCSNIASISIPDTITSIGNNAFRECSSLVSISIPKSITTIEQYLFWGCTSLTSIRMPDTITSIGDSAFQNCTSLLYPVIPSSVTEIGPSAFYGSGIASIVIPSNVTSIGAGAFEGCTELAFVTFENPNGWYADDTPISLTSSANNATLLTTTYVESTWTRQ